MNDYKELDTRLTQLKIWREDVQNTLDRIDEEIANTQEVLRGMRCALFEKQYGWGAGGLVKVPPEWDSRRKNGMKMGGNTIWQLRDTTFGDDSPGEITVQLTRTNSIISISLEDALILRQYWLDSERPARW